MDENLYFPNARFLEDQINGAAAAKKVADDPHEQMGWEPLDVDDLDQALHQVHMTLLQRMFYLKGKGILALRLAP